MAFSARKRNKKGYVGFQGERHKSVHVNHYYFYLDDEDFGPGFIKVCSYAPGAISNPGNPSRSSYEPPYRRQEVPSGTIFQRRTGLTD